MLESAGVRTQHRRQLHAQRLVAEELRAKEYDQWHARLGVTHDYDPRLLQPLTQLSVKFGRRMCILCEEVNAPMIWFW